MHTLATTNNFSVVVIDLNKHCICGSESRVTTSSVTSVINSTPHLFIVDCCERGDGAPAEL